MRLMPRRRTEWRRVLFICTLEVKAEKLRWHSATRAPPTGTRLSCGRLTGRRKAMRRVRYGLREQSHTGQPLSNTTRHWPSGSCRQIEVNVPIWRSVGSRTGLLERAVVPDARTSTISGFQEIGG